MFRTSLLVHSALSKNATLKFIWYIQLVYNTDNVKK